MREHVPVRILSILLMFQWTTAQNSPGFWVESGAIQGPSAMVNNMVDTNQNKSVTIFNEAPIPMSIHCEIHNDSNFAEHRYLQPNEALTFPLISFTESTRVWCMVTHHLVYGWLHIFDGSKRNYGTDKLKWRIRLDGIYLDGRGKRVGLGAGRGKYTVGIADGNGNYTSTEVYYLDSGVCNNFADFGVEQHAGSVTLEPQMCVVVYDRYDCDGPKLWLNTFNIGRNTWVLDGTSAFAHSFSECKYTDNVA